MARGIGPLPWEPGGLGPRHCSAAAQLCGDSGLPCFAWSVLSPLDSCGREVTLGIWLSALCPTVLLGPPVSPSVHGPHLPRGPHWLPNPLPSPHPPVLGVTPELTSPGTCRW